MLELETNFPWVHTSFSEHVYHTVRRSDRFWASIWTDLTIEQVMMRSIKSRGGLTRGRGVTESVRTMWVNTTHRCSHVHEAMTELTGLAHTTSNQHKEMGESRRQHDNKVLAKLIDWFEARNPFDQNMQGLCSLSSGVTVNDTDNINCDNAELVGEQIQQKLDGTCFEGCTVKRKDQVRTLACLRKGVHVEDEEIHVQPDVLFSRLVLLVKQKEEQINYFEYELNPEPAALFINGMMRKPVKSKLRNHLLSLVDGVDNPYSGVCVVDGGYLVH